MEYNFSTIEQKWRKEWNLQNAYTISHTSTKPKFYILDMFPYPSGAGLHVGHPHGYIASDIFARYKRLKGFNVLHPMGFDAFGLPAEQYALETGQHPAVTTEKNSARYKEQLNNIGFSFDWSREINTSDPSYYKWTQWIFLQLFNSWFNTHSQKATPIDTISIARDASIKSYLNLEPRVSAAYQLSENSSIKASYNRTAQYIHLISNTSSPTPFDIYAPSGQFIKPQLGDQFAVGYFKGFENFSLEVESYYKEVKNRIDYVDDADLIANEAIEQVVLNGETRAYGLEFLLRKTKGNLQGWLAYTLSKSEQRTPGRTAIETGINNGKWYNTAWDRTHDFSLTAQYKLSEKWFLGANFIFQTGRPATFPLGQYEYQGQVVPVYEARNASRLESFHHLDISATWNLKHKSKKRWSDEIVFSVYNVYDRKNAASVSFRKNTDTGNNEAVRLSIFGIIPAITYNFKF